MCGVIPNATTLPEIATRRTGVLSDAQEDRKLGGIASSPARTSPALPSSTTCQSATQSSTPAIYQPHARCEIVRVQKTERGLGAENRPRLLRRALLTASDAINISMQRLQSTTRIYHSVYLSHAYTVSLASLPSSLSALGLTAAIRPKLAAVGLYLAASPLQHAGSSSSDMSVSTLPSSRPLPSTISSLNSSDTVTVLLICPTAVLVRRWRELDMRMVGSLRTGPGVDEEVQREEQEEGGRLSLEVTCQCGDRGQLGSWRGSVDQAYNKEDGRVD